MRILLNVLAIVAIIATVYFTLYSFTIISKLQSTYIVIAYISIMTITAMTIISTFITVLKEMNKR